MFIRSMEEEITKVVADLPFCPFSLVQRCITEARLIFDHFDLMNR